MFFWQFSNTSVSGFQCVRRYDCPPIPSIATLSRWDGLRAHAKAMGQTKSDTTPCHQTKRAFSHSFHPQALFPAHAAVDVTRRYRR